MSLKTDAMQKKMTLKNEALCLRRDASPLSTIVNPVLSVIEKPQPKRTYADALGIIDLLKVRVMTMCFFE